MKLFSVCLCVRVRACMNLHMRVCMIPEHLEGTDKFKTNEKYVGVVSFEHVNNICYIFSSVLSQW